VRVLRTEPVTERGHFAGNLASGEGRAMRAVLDSLMVEGQVVHNLSTHRSVARGRVRGHRRHGLEEADAREGRGRMTSPASNPIVTNLRAAWATRVCPNLCRVARALVAASRRSAVVGMFAYVFVYRALGAPRQFEVVRRPGRRDDGVLAGRAVVMGTQFTGKSRRQPRVST
jgi:hypothetical protein